MQVISVILATTGVIITTLSASESRLSSTSSVDLYACAYGLCILTLALVLSDVLGHVQDWTCYKYIQPSLSSPKRNSTCLPLSRLPSGPLSIISLHPISSPNLSFPRSGNFSFKPLSVSVYTPYLSPSRLRHDHPACLRSEST